MYSNVNKKLPLKKLTLAKRETTLIRVYIQNHFSLFTLKTDYFHIFIHESLLSNSVPLIYFMFCCCCCFFSLFLYKYVHCFCEGRREMPPELFFKSLSFTHFIVVNTFKICIFYFREDFLDLGESPMQCIVQMQVQMQRVYVRGGMKIGSFIRDAPGTDYSSPVLLILSLVSSLYIKKMI